MGHSVDAVFFNLYYYVEVDGERHAPAALPAVSESPVGLPIA